MKEDIDIDFIIYEAQKHFVDAKPTHDWNHVIRVHNLCMHIGSVEGANKNILACAAYLHDIGRCFEEKDISVCHAEKGAIMANEILQEAGASQQFINAVVHCVECHRFRNDKVPTSLEAKVLYDADKLDAIGAIGIARAYAYAGEHEQMLVTDFKSNYDDDLNVDHSAHSPIKEYVVKLSKIKDKMLTREGKRIAMERDAFMKRYFSRLEEECKGEI